MANNYEGRAIPWDQMSPETRQEMLDLMARQSPDNQPPPLDPNDPAAYARQAAEDDIGEETDDTAIIFNEVDEELRTATGKDEIRRLALRIKREHDKLVSE